MLNDFNEAQQNAVTSNSPSIAIVAGPGTGKTKTLVGRLSYLLIEKHIAPEKILAITFTRKAAAEIKDRLTMPLGQKTPFVGTFHSLALHILSDDAIKIADQKTLATFANKKTLREVSMLKNNLEESELVKTYNQKLFAVGMVDYDDLLLLLFKKLNHKDEIPNMEHVLVDEFQDTNPLQYKILKRLNAKNYFVIGDPKQSVYSFRGTNEKIFEEFTRDHPNTRQITLTKNYRSAPEIIKTYQTLFPQTSLLPTKTIKGEALLLDLQNEFSEATWIVNYIRNYVGGLQMQDAQESQGTFSDIAILYRTHRFKRVLEQKLQQSGIPFQVVGGGSFYEDPEIQAFISQIINKKTKFKSLLSAIDILLSASLKKEELKSNVSRFGNGTKSVSRFLEYTSELQNHEYFDPHANCVTLSTMHASKGLEFEFVFVCGCEEGIIPSKRNDLDEERRLFYVAMSRAKKGLYLTFARRRNKRRSYKSTFLKRLEIKTLVHHSARKKRQLKLF